MYFMIIIMLDKICRVECGWHDYFFVDVNFIGRLHSIINMIYDWPYGRCDSLSLTFMVGRRLFVSLAAFRRGSVIWAYFMICHSYDAHSRTPVRFGHRRQMFFSGKKVGSDP